MKKCNKRILMLLFALGAMFIMATSVYAKPGKPGTPCASSVESDNQAIIYFRRPTNMHGYDYYNVRLYTPYQNKKVVDYYGWIDGHFKGFPCVIVNTPSNKYCYKVRVRGESQYGWGPWSGTGYVIPQPINFSISSNGLVKWKGIVGASKYRVFISRSKDSGYRSLGYFKNPQVKLNPNSMSVGNYYIRVQTIMANGKKGKSSHYTYGVRIYRTYY